MNNGVVWSGTWWGMAGYRNAGSGALEGVGNSGTYWSSTRYTAAAYCSYNLFFNYNGDVNPSNSSSRSNAYSVRCVQKRGRVARPKASEGGGEAESREAGRGAESNEV